MAFSGETSATLIFFLLALCAAFIRAGFSCSPAERAAIAAALSALRNRSQGAQGIAVVVGWIARLGVPRRDRADLAQDVLEAAVKSWDRFDPDYEGGDPARRSSDPETRRNVLFARWLNRITMHVVSHYYDRERRRPGELTVDPFEAERADPAPDAAESVTREEERLEILDALRSTDPHGATILIAHDIDGVPMAEIAAQLRLPLSTAYKHHARARVALRAEIERRRAKER
ncbi:RNA polymerase sigma factor [Sorangium sp. So ce118]